jgi:hypothetical protein
VPGFAPRLLRAGALGGSLLVLAADVVDECDEWAAPVAFRVVESDCGALGLIVVEPLGRGLAVHNVAATFGLIGGPGFDGGSYNSSSSWSSSGYRGCPARLTEGGWYFTGYICSTPQASVPYQGGVDGGGCASVQRRCTAELEGGALWVTCSADGGGGQCRARLTVEDQ